MLNAEGGLKFESHSKCCKMVTLRGLPAMKATKGS